MNNNGLLCFAISHGVRQERKRTFDTLSPWIGGSVQRPLSLLPMWPRAPNLQSALKKDLHEGATVGTTKVQHVTRQSHKQSGDEIARRALSSQHEKGRQIVADRKARFRTTTPPRRASAGRALPCTRGSFVESGDISFFIRRFNVAGGVRRQTEKYPKGPNLRVGDKAAPCVAILSLRTSITRANRF